MWINKWSTPKILIGEGFKRGKRLIWTQCTLKLVWSWTAIFFSVHCILLTLWILKSIETVVFNIRQTPEHWNMLQDFFYPFFFYMLTCQHHNTKTAIFESRASLRSLVKKTPHPLIGIISYSGTIVQALGRSGSYLLHLAVWAF